MDHKIQDLSLTRSERFSKVLKYWAQRITAKDFGDAMNLCLKSKLGQNVSLTGAGIQLAMIKRRKRRQKESTLGDTGNRDTVVWCFFLINDLHNYFIVTICFYSYV